MRSQKARLREQKTVNSDFADNLDAASPPAPSRNGNFRLVHDEIPIIQNVARVHLASVMEAVAQGRIMSWPKFQTDSTPHRNIASESEIERFLKSKLLSPKRS